MKKKMFSVFDTKALFYTPPFVVPTTGVALRMFADIANNPETDIARHPSDYMLFQIGEMDDNSGVVSACVPFISLGNASEFVTHKKEVLADVMEQKAPLVLSNVNGGESNG